MRAAKSAPTKVIRLISHSKESADRVRQVEAAGFSVDASEHEPGRVIGQTRDLVPDVVLIDLDRLPSHGRTLAVVLRTAKSTCHIPIVFAGGEPEKVARARQDLPDAAYTTWKSVAAALKRAIKQAPPQPVKPMPYMQQWAGSSLVKKLGLKPASKVVLLGAPAGFEEQLGEMPENVEFRTAITRQATLVIWFVRSWQELEGEIAFLADRLPQGVSVWIAFPKQSSRFRVDFNSNDVRSAGLAAGLVDYKVCAIDADWSALKFARKKL